MDVGTVRVGGVLSRQLTLLNPGDCALRFRLFTEQSVSGPHPDHLTRYDPCGAHRCLASGPKHSGKNQFWIQTPLESSPQLRLCLFASECTKSVYNLQGQTTFIAQSSFRDFLSGDETRQRETVSSSICLQRLS